MTFRACFVLCVVLTVLQIAVGLGVFYAWGIGVDVPETIALPLLVGPFVTACLAGAAKEAERDL